MNKLTLILIGCLLSGCGLLGSDDNRTLSDDLMPLQVGNWWNYEVRNHLFQNPVVDTVRYEVTAEVPITVEGASTTAFAFNLLPFPEGMPEYYWLTRNTDEGLYLMGGIAETDTLIMNEIEYKLEAKIGDSWQVPQVSFSRSDLEFYISDTLEITLLGKDRLVETPAGTFHCFVYHFEADQGADVAGNTQIFQFYCPGYGLVKQEERTGSNNHLITELVLIRYHIQ